MNLRIKTKGLSFIETIAEDSRSGIKFNELIKIKKEDYYEY